MRKIGIFLLLILSATSTLMAAPVSKDKALGIARNFLAFHGATIGKNPSPMKVSRRDARGDDKAQELYIFNADNEQGFVIVSGDDRTSPVLGFSTSGSIDVKHIPVQLQDMLDMYSEEIRLLQDSHRTKSQTNQDIYPTIKPLIKAYWGQDCPYNNACPETDGLPSASGCVATATAMVMDYYQYPQQTIKTIPAYTTSSYKYQMTAIPEGTPIKWNDIRKEYSDDSNISSSEIDAISSLMLMVGKAMRTDYGKASGAFTSNAVEALKNYLGYDSRCIGIDRWEMTLKQWNDIIYQELKAHRPVLYSGLKYKGGYGHCFIVDGYQDGFFHVNWGWDGNNNGYFLLSSLDYYQPVSTTSSESTFSCNQNAIINICPGNSELTMNHGKAHLHFQSGFSKDAEDRIILDSYYQNVSTNFCSFDLGYAVLNDDNTIHHVSEGIKCVDKSPGYIGNFMTYALNDMTDGTFRIAPVYRQDGESDWRMDDNIASTVMNVVVKNNYITDVTLAEDSMNLEIGEPKWTRTPIMGKDITFQINVTNNYYRAFEGNLCLIAEPTEGNGRIDSCKVCMRLDAWESQNAEMHFLPDCEGTWNLKIVNEEHQVLKSFSVDVLPAKNQSLTGKIVLMNLCTTPDGSKVFADGKVKLKFQVKNTKEDSEYVGDVDLKICSEDRRTQETVTNFIKSYPVRLAPGEFMEKEVTLDGLEVGSKYCFFLGDFNQNNSIWTITEFYLLSDMTLGIHQIPTSPSLLRGYDWNGREIKGNNYKGIVIKEGKKYIDR